MILCVFLERIDTWTRLHTRMVVMFQNSTNRPLLVGRNIRIFSKHTRMTKWQMEFQGMLVMRASFLMLWMSGGTKPDK